MSEKNMRHEVTYKLVSEETIPLAALPVGEPGIVVRGAHPLTNDSSVGDLVFRTNNQVVSVSGWWDVQFDGYVVRRLRPNESVTIKGK